MKTYQHTNGICYSNVREYENDSVKAAMERNDCVVCAIASSFDVKYDEAHDYVKKLFGRKDKKGTFGVVMKMRGLQEAFGKNVEELGEERPDLGPGKHLRVKYRMNREWKEGGYTTVSFLKAFPKGTYFILASMHAFTIKDGVVIGNETDASSLRVRIKQAFKIG